MFWAKIGAKRPNYGQKGTVCWHRLVRSATVILADRDVDRTVRGDHGRYRNYGPKSNFTAYVRRPDYTRRVGQSQVSAPLTIRNLMFRVGQDRLFTTYMTVYLVIPLPKIPYLHHLNLVLANPTDVQITTCHQKV